MENFIDEIYKLLEKASEDFEEKKKEKSLGVAHRFNDYLMRLKSRYQLLKENQKECDSIGISNSKSSKIIQMEFVDRTEAFNQHIYACISAFILLLTHFEKKKIVNHLPISTTTKFLKFLRDENKGYRKYINAVDLLSYSTKFRSKFVDHPQQHANFDRYTYDYKGTKVIVYFIRENDKVYYYPACDPFSKDFKPSVDTQEFHISPDSDKLYAAFKFVIKERLKMI